MPPFLLPPLWVLGGAWPTCSTRGPRVRRRCRPPQGDLNLPGLSRPRGLCSGHPLVRKEDPPDVVPGAVIPVITVEAAPRFGRDGLYHHPVRALEQVLDGDVVSSPRAGDAPGHVVKSHLDPTPDYGRVVLSLQPRPCHSHQRVRKFAYDQPV
jgi:hypothetical protein